MMNWQVSRRKVAFINLYQRLLEKRLEISYRAVFSERAYTDDSSSVQDLKHVWFF